MFYLIPLHNNKLESSNDSSIDQCGHVDEWDSTFKRPSQSSPNGVEKERSARLCEALCGVSIAAVLAHCCSFSSCCGFHGTVQSDAAESKHSFEVCV